MIWGCFSGSGLGPSALVKGTLNATGYKYILDIWMLPTLWQLRGGPFLFKHDCALRTGITRLVWRKSSGLQRALTSNPFEHLSEELERQLRVRCAGRVSTYFWPYSVCCHNLCAWNSEIIIGNKFINKRRWTVCAPWLCSTLFHKTNSLVWQHCVSSNHLFKREVSVFCSGYAPPIHLVVVVEFSCQSTGNIAQCTSFFFGGENTPDIIPFKKDKMSFAAQILFVIHIICVAHIPFVAHVPFVVHRN